MWMKRAASLLVVVSLAAACGTQTPPTSSSPSTSGAPSAASGPVGHIVTVATSLSGTGQDHAQTSVHGFRDYWDEIFDWVIDQEPSGKLAPGLATSWTASDDHLTWTFAIREGVKFHNGDTLGAADVAWSWNRLIFDPGSKHVLVGLAPDIESITAVGNDAIIKTKAPMSTLPLVFARLSGTQGAILPKAYFESVGSEKFFLNPVGTGPYKFVKADGEQSVDLTAFLDDGRNDWQKDRTPKFKDLTVSAVPDASTRVALLKTGDADVVPLPISAIEDVKASGSNVITVPGSNYSVMLCVGFTLNPASPCDNQKVREALSISIDRATIAKSVYLGFAVPSNAFFSGPGSFGNPKDLPAPAFDPDRARQLLTEAGFGPGHPLKVQIGAYNDDLDFPMMPTMAEAIAGYYKDVGVEATLLMREWGAHEDALEKGELPGMRNNPAIDPVFLWMRGSDNRYDFAAEQISAYTDAGKKGRAAWDNTKLPEQQTRLDAIENEFDLVKREALLADYQRWMGVNFNQIPLLASDAVFGTSKKIASWDVTVAGKTYVHNQWSLVPSGN
jgi:peptide/nickel transport system substrate-binding protein